MSQALPPERSTASEPSPFRLGFQRALPIILGYLPVGFAFGVLAVKNNIPPSLAVALSIGMFAGAGQFVTISMWISGAGLVSTTVAVLVTNLRYLLMSLALVPHSTSLKGIPRFIFGWHITDEIFAVNVTALQNGWPINLTTLFSTSFLAQAGWVGGTALGVFCGGLLTDVKPLGLDYALTGMFIALVVPQCTDRPQVVVALLAAILSVCLRLAGLGQWNVVLATVIAASIGVLLTQRRTPSSKAA